MAEIIKFPKEPRSSFEQAVRDGIRQALLMGKRSVPDVLVEQAVTSVLAAAEVWQSGRLELSFDLKTTKDPRTIEEVKGIVADAGERVRRFMFVNALRERVELEIKLALLRG
jgi:hypothetical protein